MQSKLIPALGCFALILYSLEFGRAQDEGTSAEFTLNAPRDNYECVSFRIYTPVEVSTITFELSSLELDATPRLLLGAGSFQHGFFITATNVGWGDLPPKDTLFANQELLSQRGLSIEPIQLQSPLVNGQNVATSETWFFAHRRDHDPYGFWQNGDHFFVESFRPQLLAHYSLDQSGESLTFVPREFRPDLETDNGPASRPTTPLVDVTDSRLDELYVQFGESVISPFGYIWQPIRLEIEEKQLDRMLGTNLRSGFAEKCLLSFGNTDEFAHGGGAGQQPYGITVDFRGQQKVTVRTRGLKPGNVIHAQFITEKSCYFTVDWQLKDINGIVYAKEGLNRVGNRFHSVVGRTVNMDFAETTKCLTQLLDQNNYEPKPTLSLTLIPIETLAHKFQGNRLFLEQLQVAYCIPSYSSELPRRLDLVEEFYKQLIATNVICKPLTLQGQDLEAIHRTAFSILCKCRPKVAIPLAIELLRKGHIRPLAIALVVKETREHLSHSEKTLDGEELANIWRSRIEGNDGSSNHDRSAIVILASLLGWNNWQIVSHDHTGIEPSFAYAYKFSRNETLRNNLASLLSRPRSIEDPDSTIDVIEILRLVGPKGFVAPISQLITECADDPSSKDILLAGLRYLEASQVHESPCYYLLIDCPFSAEIRDLASKLCAIQR